MIKFKAWLVLEKEWGDVIEINIDKATGIAYEIKTIFGELQHFANGKSFRRQQWNELLPEEAVLYKEVNGEYVKV